MKGIKRNDGKTGRLIGRVPYYEKKTGRKLRPPVKALYDAMYEARVTHAEVAEASGVSTTALSRWFCDGVMPSIDLYEAVAGALGYEVRLIK